MHSYAKDEACWSYQWYVFALSIYLSIRKFICLVSAICIEHTQFQQANITKKLVSSEMGV